MYKNYDRAVMLYLSDCESNDLSGESITLYRRIFRYYREFLEKNGLEDASYEATSMWKTELHNNVTIVTMDLYLKQLCRLSQMAVKFKLYDEPFADEGILPKSKKVSKAKKNSRMEYEHVLSEDDVSALINAEKAIFAKTPHTFKREKAVVTLALTTGLRNIELRNLRLKDLNFAEGYIFAHITKGDKPRFVPFVQVAQDCINDYLNSGLRPSSASMDDCLFGVNTRSGEWRPFERTELSELIYRYEKSIIGEEKASRSHALRHSFASRAYTRGIPLSDIAQILGHSDVQTTTIYSKNLNPEKFASDFGQKMMETIEEETA